jgi:hypothetical protein
VNATAIDLSGGGQPAGRPLVGREEVRSAPSPDAARGSAAQWVPSALVLVVIIAVSLVPGWDPGLPGPRHLPHAVAYAAWMVTILVLAQRRSGTRPGVMVAAAVGLAFLVITIGGLLELAQGVVHRDVEALDVAADAAGVAAALAAWLILRTVRALGSR